MTLKEVSSRFSVGIASVVRWSKRLKPQKTRNKPATKIDMQALARDGVRLKVMSNKNYCHSAQ